MEISLDSGLIIVILIIWILVLIFGYREINELMDFRGDIQLYLGSEILSFYLFYDNISNQNSIEEVRSIEESGQLEDSVRD